MLKELWYLTDITIVECEWSKKILLYIGKDGKKLSATYKEQQIEALTEMLFSEVLDYVNKKIGDVY